MLIVLSGIETLPDLVRPAAMMEADQNGDGKLDFDEFKGMVANTDIAKQMVGAVYFWRVLRPFLSSKLTLLPRCPHADSRR